jgi:hypothetical protein
VMKVQSLFFVFSFASKNAYPWDNVGKGSRRCGHRDQGASAMFSCFTHHFPRSKENTRLRLSSEWLLGLWPSRIGIGIFHFLLSYSGIIRRIGETQITDTQTWINACAHELEETRTRPCLDLGVEFDFSQRLSPIRHIFDQKLSLIKTTPKEFTSVSEQWNDSSVFALCSTPCRVADGEKSIQVNPTRGIENSEMIPPIIQGCLHLRR